jgi:hypothetical protein
MDEQVAETTETTSTAETPVDKTVAASTEVSTDTSTTTETAPTSFLSEANREHPSAAKFKDADGLFKSYTEMESMVGRKGIIQPNKEDEADVARYRAEMGIPDSADKYELNEPTEFTEKHGYNQDFMRNTALKWGLTEEQAKGVEADYLADASSNIDRQAAAQKDATGKATQELSSEWGEDFGAKMQMAERVIDNFSNGDEAFANEMKDAIKANPKLAKMFAEQGSQFAEHRIGNFETPQDVASIDAARTERSEIMSADKKAHPYWSDKDPVAHQEAIARMEVLNKMIGTRG